MCVRVCVCVCVCLSVCVRSFWAQITLTDSERPQNLVEALKTEARRREILQEALMRRTEDLQRRVADNAESPQPNSPRVNFVALDSGATFQLPTWKELRRVIVGVGWDRQENAKRPFVSDRPFISAVLFDANQQTFGACYSNSPGTAYNAYPGGVSTCLCGHCADSENPFCAGKYDALQMLCCLDEVDSRVSQILFVANSKHKFDDVFNGYCRIYDSHGQELACYALCQLAESRALKDLVLARLFREDDKQWCFQALGAFSSGRVDGDFWRERTCGASIPHLQPILNEHPRDAPLRRAPWRLDASDASTDCCATQ